VKDSENDVKELLAFGPSPNPIAFVNPILDGPAIVSKISIGEAVPSEHYYGEFKDSFYNRYRAYRGSIHAPRQEAGVTYRDHDAKTRL
jgi:hypothetical protein